MITLTESTFGECLKPPKKCLKFSVFQTKWCRNPALCPLTPQTRKNTKNHTADLQPPIKPPLTTTTVTPPPPTRV